MGKFVRISSTKYINVYAGLQCKNVTTGSEAIPNRLRVASYWNELNVRILEGVCYYPSVIKEWPAVQALAKDEVITIGEEKDDLGEENDRTVYAKTLYENLYRTYEGLEGNGVENPFKPKKTTTSKKEKTNETSNTNKLIEE